MAKAAKFEYSFDISSDKNGYMLSFHDFKAGSFQASTRDKVIIMAQEFLDDTLYTLLKSKKPIPVPSRNVSPDKRMAPSEAIALALEFHIDTDHNK